MIINVTWEVDDGYAGGSAPHNLEVNTNDFVNDDDEWNELTEEQKENYIADAVQDDFDNSINWYITSKEVQ